MNRTATRLEQYHVGSHRHANWALKSPPAIRLALPADLDNFALSTMPKAPERIRAEYARRGSPAVTPAVVRAIASDLNLHERTVERVLYNLPRTTRPVAAPVLETTAMPPLSPAAVPTAAPVADTLLAIFPATKPDWWPYALSWDTAREISAELDRLRVDLRYGIPAADKAAIAQAVGIQPDSVGTYSGAIRKLRGVKFVSVHKPKDPMTRTPLAQSAAVVTVTKKPATPAPAPQPSGLEPPTGLAPEHVAVWRAWAAAGWSPTEYLGWHDKERLAVGLKIAAGKVHRAQSTWLELLQLPYPKAPDQKPAKPALNGHRPAATAPEIVRENQAPVAEPVAEQRAEEISTSPARAEETALSSAYPAPDILPDGGHVAHVPQPPTCQHCAGLGVADGCPDCGAGVASAEPTELDQAMARISELRSLQQKSHQLLDSLGVAKGYVHERIQELANAQDAGLLSLTTLESQVNAADADHRECLRLLTEAGADTSGETMALNLVQLIEERDSALADLQKLREEAEAQRDRFQQRWRTVNRYETELMPCLQRHPNGVSGETPLEDRLVTALQATVAELEGRKPQVRLARGLVAPTLPRLTRGELRTALALIDEATGPSVELWEGIPTARLSAVLLGAAHLAEAAVALEGDGGQE